MSVEELDKIVDEILSEAENEKSRIIAYARTRAREILERPIPIDDYRREAEAILNHAREEAEMIVKEAEKKAEKVRSVGKERFEQAVALLLEYVLGLRGE